MEKTAIGIDGCRGGWVAIGRALSGGKWLAVVIQSISELYEAFTDPAVVGIDIPVGLTETGPRECDRLARNLLGTPRSSSVFPAPVRPALAARTRLEADEIHRRVDGRGVGVQSWGLYPRIREIDNYLRGNPEAARIFYEVHPELAFMAWNHDSPIAASKKTPAGRNQRMELVTNFFGADVFIRAREVLPRGKVLDDDILDALAVLWTAERICRGEHQVVPSPPQVDSEGLKMGIWY